ncbi:MBL fold metallo-hydrolase [Calidifontibacter sp. DB0510]|uniref:MBL fold metallo-hydrolase n=1 Tax=Metallococcus carri TaxID=1656884 RepID=A0A967B1T9_9MICO|nr:MBL fold metallo-hydrolase [Metallococcus carri]NHN55735.1 MBL fold metallo-hydrolase [Metallococcus carri]NOP38576.1 MBL fold metallo-hydrolase [Calidifontibacter sp. DB2511S]
MRLIPIGVSGSFAGPDSAASCYLLQAEHDGRTWNLVLDLGSGALGPLQRFVALDQIDAIVISHLHPDHCLDLTGLFVVRKYHPGTGGLPGRLPVYGPQDTAARMSRANGVTYAEAIDPRGLDTEFDFRVLTSGRAFTVGPFTITPHLMNHPVEAFGVRVEADGRVLAYTGDTDACPALTPLLANAHVALMDSAFVDGRDEVADIHLSGRRAAEAAVAAGGVSRLMLTHIPPWNDPQVCRSQAAAVWPGEVELARAGTAYDI